MSTRKSGFNISKTSFASAYMEPILLDLERTDIGSVAVSDLY